jgi:rRNA small subunit pseudouridine methyltransferase Nep1
MSLLFVLAESALETIPRKILSHPSILHIAKKRGLNPRNLLLDRSYHHRAMGCLKNSQKRGRPDIAHITLLDVLGTPLNKRGLLKTYIHTTDNHIIELSSKIRLPRNYNRFVGLFEQLYKLKNIPKDEEFLLSLYKENLTNLINRLKPSRVFAFSSIGNLKRVGVIGKMLAKENKPLIIIGGFAHGHFKKETLNLADEIISISQEALEASIVASRIIYEYEVSIGLNQEIGENMGEGMQ